MDTAEAYEEAHRKAKTWIEEKEAQVGELLVAEDQGTNRKEYLNLIKATKKDIEHYHTELLALGKMSEGMTKSMDTATVIQVTSQETSLSQRLLNMQQTLGKHIQNLDKDIDRYVEFEEHLQQIDASLAHADDVLSKEDPTKTSEEDELRHRLQELKELSQNFSTEQAVLEKLNELGYRLPLSEAESARLKQMNHRWLGLSGDTTERYRTLQHHMLLTQDFSQKCEEWMTYLCQVEKDLASPLAGNEEELKEQQALFQVRHFCHHRLHFKCK